MSAVYMSFLSVIVLIARECACEWQRDFGDGNRFLPRDEILARYMLWPCVVCLCSAKTNKQRITQQQ